MTEKEFLHRAYSDDRLSLLNLAKEAGAKFDPEPVELPPLKSTGNDDNQISMIISQSEPKALKKFQCDEIIRRCKVVEILRNKAIANKIIGFLSVDVDYILKVIDTGSEL